MDFLNLTPHPITIQKPDGSSITLAPSGQVARVSTNAQDAGYVAGIPVIRQIYGSVQGLPDPKPDTVCLVSALVLSAVKAAGGRADVFAPDTGPQSAIRDDQGRIVAVKRLIQAL